MYTEAELREALQISATRVETLTVDRSLRTRPSWAIERSSRRSWAAAAVAAAAVAAASVTAIVTVDQTARHGSPAAVSAAAPIPPLNSAMSLSTSVSSPPIGRAPIAVTNLLTVQAAGDGYSLGPAGQVQIVPVGGADAVDVIAVPAAGFDPSTQLRNSQRVSVAGTSGYFGYIAGGLATGADAGKYGPPKTTLAWQSADGTWVFIQGMNSGVNLSLSTLLNRYNQLGISATPRPLPLLPYRVGWLPAGLTVSSIESDPSNASPYASTVELTAGSNLIDINVYRATTNGNNPVQLGGDSSRVYATRTVGEWQFTVAAQGYSQDTVGQILNDLDLSKVSDTPSTWWISKAAFNG